MTTLTPTLRRPVLADRIFPRSLAVDAGLVVAGAALTAGAAQLALPVWPVPITGQTFAVLLVGTTLGWARGALAMVVYTVAGLLGAPVFTSGGHGGLIGTPAGGYVIGFVFAAALVGWMASREWDRQVLRTIVSFAAGSVVIYAFGLPWLAVTLGQFGPSVWHTQMGYSTLAGATFGSGLVPFLIGDLGKACVAGLLIPAVWTLVRRADARK